MKLRDRIGRTLLTAGGDGVVREWNLIWDAPDKPEVEPSTNGPWDLTPGNPDKPTIIALDCMENSETFVAGDDRNDIWEVDEDPKVMIRGSQAM